MLALQTVESSWIRNRKRGMKLGTEFGDVGSHTASLQESPITLSLLLYPTTDKHLLIRAFFGLYQTARWSVSGRLEGQHTEPLVANTLRAATSCLAASFRDNFESSPLHIPGSQNLHPSIKALFKAFENVDPPTSRQKAITPRLLRKLFEASHHPSIKDTAPAVVADIVIGAFFFAMRSCEYSKPHINGKTKCVDLDGLIFRTANNTVAPHSDPELLVISEFVTVIFVNQKNGKKMDSRTQRKTGDPHLCPILR
jgi:hypothetical protein